MISIAVNTWLPVLAVEEEDLVIISSHSFLDLLRWGLVDIPTHVLEGGGFLSDLTVSLASP